MNVFRATIDCSRLQARINGGQTVFERTLDRFTGRAANEVAREVKLQAPKGFTTLTNSVAVDRSASADYRVTPKARYAAAVHGGGKPHKAPLLPLMLWLKYTKRVTEEKELRRRTYALRRYIELHGTRANPFVTRARIKQQGRVLQLLRAGVAAATDEAYGS